MESHPRVNSALLPKCRGKTVRVVGRVLGVNPSTGEAILEACDQGQVTVQLLQGSMVNDCTNGVVEILGRVQPNLAVQESASTRLLDDWDPSAYNKMVMTSMEYDYLFGWWS